MQKVSSLLSDLFSSSFKLAVPSLFRGMVQNLQDQVLKDKIMSFIEHGFSPSLIEMMANDQTTKEGIKTQIKLACEEELGDVVLRLSTEDCFDLLCDLAVRHGRNLKVWGPPCACSFARCLPCLERLVRSIKTTPPTPPADIKPIDATDLIEWIEELIEGEEDYDSWNESADWRARVTAAWERMAEILWQTASDIDPLSLARVKCAHQTLTKLNGLDLFYTVVTREITALDANKETITGLEAGSMTLSGQYERMKRENKKLKAKDGKAAADEVDEVGADYRRALARAVREQGNTAYAAELYQEATEHYTRAIGYDATEPIYPLNRAACLLKLKRFSEAEKDCTAALLLDPGNHKAFFRRGVSKAGMGKVDEAREDFESVLRLQESNPQAREELRKLSEQFLAEAPTNSDAEGLEVGEVEPPLRSALKKGKGKATLNPSLEARPSAFAARSPGRAAGAVLTSTSSESSHAIPAKGRAIPTRAKDGIAEIAKGLQQIWKEPVPKARDKGGSQLAPEEMAASSDIASVGTETLSSTSPVAGATSLPGSGYQRESSPVPAPSTPPTSNKSRSQHSWIQDEGGPKHGFEDQGVGLVPERAPSSTSSCSDANDRGDTTEEEPTPPLPAGAMKVSDEQLDERWRLAEEAAMQVSFAYLFGLIVEQRTGVDVLSQAGFGKGRFLDELGWEAGRGRVEEEGETCDSTDTRREGVIQGDGEGG
ncbi:hypothetical protein IE53DRAFT_362895 [Violaceomyces palustris]|uniref:Uncharacterized protein n=1 Tax=Violaceomyces palustris TaxID=1673888 RepID=A0ACD0NVC0_9BASI|nr:hypothetical protein IE53DRAFT_362895 [Violaceomyces palustris]